MNGTRWAGFEKRRGRAVSAAPMSMTAWGRLTEKMDASGRAARISYDAGNRPIEIRFQRGEETLSSKTFRYDSRGILEEIREDGYAVRLHLSGEDRRASLEYVPPEGDGYQITYYYSAGRKPERVEYPGGYREEYRYDHRNRLIQKESGTGERTSLVSYAYDDKNRLASKRLDSGIEYRFGYTEEGIIKEVSCREGDKAVESLLYAYDLQGNRSAITRHSVKEGTKREYTCHCDRLGRICAVREGGKTLRAYEYDTLGNRIEKTEGEFRTSYTYDEAGMLLSEIKSRIFRADGTSEKPEERAYEYDEDGKVTGIIKNGVPEYRYHYDAQGRLARVENQKGEIISYGYDPLGYRYKKSVACRSEEANPTPLQIFEITDPIRKGRLVHRSLAGDGLARKEWYTWDFSLNRVQELEEREGTVTVRETEYLSDEWGTPLRSFGETERAYRFDEFGGWEEEAEEDTLEGMLLHPVGFAGYRPDRESGSYYTKWRQYCARTGRFMRRDRKKGRMDYLFTLNPYTYCFNMPTYFVDTDGAWPSQPAIWMGELEEGWEDFKEADGGFAEWFSREILKESFYERMEDIGPYLDAWTESYFESRYRHWETNYLKGFQNFLKKAGLAAMGVGRFVCEIPGAAYPFVWVPGVSRYMSVSDVSAKLTQSELGERVLRYFNFERTPDGVYHTSRSCWQQFLGYNDFYDYVFEGVTSMQSEKLDFTVEVDGVEKEYVFWLWKGDYYNLGAGGEVGIYEGGGFHKQCAVDTNLMMSLQIYKGDGVDGDLILDYDPKTRLWWGTGFNPEYQDTKAEDLTLVSVIDFSKEPELFRAFRAQNRDEDKLQFDRKNMLLTITW